MTLSRGSSPPLSLNQSRCGIGSSSLDDQSRCSIGSSSLDNQSRCIGSSSEILPTGNLSPKQIDQNIKNKIDDGSYCLSEAPLILSIENDKVYIQKEGFNQDKLEGVNSDMMITPNLRASCHGGEYYLNIGMINTNYFENREKFETLFSSCWEGAEEEFTGKKGLFFEQISLQTALKDAFSIKFKCNMEYYLSDRDALEKDLGHNTENYSMKTIKKELFFKLSLRILGNESNKEETELSTVILRDFRILFDNGNEVFAAARRGTYYLFFYYMWT